MAAFSRYPHVDHATYNADTGAEVVREIPAFLAEAEYLCAERERRLA